MTATTHTTPLRQRLIEQMQIANLADTTRECYVREIRRLAEHYGQSPDRLDAEQIRAWIMILIERGLSPASVNVTIAAFKFFFRDTLGRPEIIAGLRNRKVPRKLPRYLEVSEVERLLLATPDLRYRAAMLLAYAGGLRISETVALQLTDIKSDKQLLHIRQAKGGTERMVPLPNGVLEYLRSYWRNICPRPATWLFYASSPDARIKEATLTFAFNKARERAGIDRSHTFHCLRHSAATHLHERGGSIDVIQDVLGHRNADTTRRYARATGKMFQTLDHPISGFAVLRA